jgi:hypothetical protein
MPFTPNKDATIKDDYTCSMKQYFNLLLEEDNQVRASLQINSKKAITDSLENGIGSSLEKKKKKKNTKTKDISSKTDDNNDNNNDNNFDNNFDNNNDYIESCNNNDNDNDDDDDNDADNDDDNCNDNGDHNDNVAEMVVDKPSAPVSMARRRRMAEQTFIENIQNGTFSTIAEMKNAMAVELEDPEEMLEELLTKDIDSVDFGENNLHLLRVLYKHFIEECKNLKQLKSSIAPPPQTAKPKQTLPLKRKKNNAKKYSKEASSQGEARRE